uniref:Uncharacterized protein n=1 Tax=Octopus bimaculoides TaxID=37653 RepID=A0A0L8G8U5_OCTBM
MENRCTSSILASAIIQNTVCLTFSDDNIVQSHFLRKTFKALKSIKLVSRAWMFALTDIIFNYPDKSMR